MPQPTAAIPPCLIVGGSDLRAILGRAEASLDWPVAALLSVGCRSLPPPIECCHRGLRPAAGTECRI